MATYRKHLPQLHGTQLFLTDGGLETTLIFKDGVSLPHFAAFVLLDQSAGTVLLENYYRRYADMAVQYGTGIILEAPTWRANPDWGRKLGYGPEELADANRRAISLMLRIRSAYENEVSKMIISGNIGPRGDGYHVDAKMTTEAAQDYHAEQISTFAHTDADMVAAFTMTYVEEAIGIVRAAHERVMPVAISFTLETDGRLPSGESLQSAILRTDEETGNYPIYYMINCAHPTHLQQGLKQEGRWLERIRGIRANASSRSHKELDEATELDEGNPDEFGRLYKQLRAVLPMVNVVGGCCGTDHRHVDSVCHEMIHTRHHAAYRGVHARPASRHSGDGC